MQKNYKILKRTDRSVTFLLVIIIAVLINVVGVKLFKNLKLDLTENKAYTLSDVSKKVVKNLEDPLRIKVFFSKNIPAPHNNTERYLRDLLNEYDRVANRNFKYEFYDCTESKADTSEKIKNNLEVAKNYRINPVRLRTIKEDEQKLIKAYMGMAIINGDIIERISPIEGTSGLEYKITGIIEKMNNKISSLLSLPDGAVKVKLYLSSSLLRIAPYMRIEGLENVEAKLKTLVGEIRDESFGKVSFESYDSTFNKDIEQKIRELGITPLNWKAFKDPRTGKTIPAGSGNAAVVVSYGGENEMIELIDVVRVPFFGTQYRLQDIGTGFKDQISSSIDNLLKTGDKIAYLSSHGCIDISDSQENPYMQQMRGKNESEGAKFRQFLEKRYSIEEVTPEDIDQSIPSMIIAGATESFSDYELFQIDQYLLNGRSLIVFYDSLIQEMPQNQNPYGGGQPTFRPNRSGLGKLLEHYGVKVEPSYVLDSNCYVYQGRNPMGGGQSRQPVYFMPQIQSPTINQKLDFVKNLKLFFMRQVSPVYADKEKLAEVGVNAERVFSSSKSSWTMKDRIMLNPAYISVPPESDMESVPLAWVLEGPFTSYFKTKGIPEKEANEQDAGSKPFEKSSIDSKDAFIKTGKPGKIFVVGTSEILKADLLPSEDFPNTHLVLNIIDHLNDKDGWAVMRSKDQQFNPIEPQAKKTASFFKTFNGVIVPLLVIIAGILVLYARRRYKEKIKKAFMG